jgi:hypothetical protein
VAAEFDEATAEKLFVSNPAAVLAGEPLPAGRIDVPTRRRKRWFRRG